MKILYTLMLCMIWGIYSPANGQYSSDGELKISSLSEDILVHPGTPDTLVSKLSFDVFVFIKQKGKARMGASPVKDSVLVKGKGMGLDKKRLRNNGDAVSLILKIPSDRSNPGKPVLQSVLTKFNEHFTPTYTVTDILPGNRGMEITYHFAQGLPDLAEDHGHIKPPIETHFVGHICDPDDRLCQNN